MMMQAAAETRLAELAALFTASFQGYFFEVRMTPELLAEKIRADGVDLTASRVVVDDNGAVGVALLARRGWTTRVAGMGLVPESRGRGHGRWLMDHLMNEAAARSDRQMVLEVIAKNTAAVRLYRGCGFVTEDRLVGYRRAAGDGGGEESETLSETLEVDVREVAGDIVRWGAPNLPWPLSGENLCHAAPPSAAFRLGPAQAILSDPRASRIVLKALIVDPAQRGHGAARRLLAALIARFPDRSWKIPALVPEKLGAGLLHSLGFVKDSLTQLQMRADLSGRV